MSLAHPVVYQTGLIKCELLSRENKALSGEVKRSVSGPWSEHVKEGRGRESFNISIATCS